MNNIILGNLGQDRRMGNGAKVLVDILDRSLGTGISAGQPTFAKGGIHDIHVGWGQKVRILL